MIILDQFDEFGPGFGFPSIKEFISLEPFDHKDTMAQFGCVFSDTQE